MAQYIDISVPVSDRLPVWPGVAAPWIEHYARMDEGADANIARLQMDLHTGTHLDAPRHFLPQGRSLQACGLNAVIGACRVVDLRGQACISAAVLEAANLPPTSRLLIRANAADYYDRPVFDPDYCSLDVTAARWLVRRNLQLVGIDCLSIEPFVNDDFAVHKTLLAHDVLILEGLSLAHVPPGDYTLCALPLHLEDTEAAPVRAVLLPPLTC